MSRTSLPTRTPPTVIVPVRDRTAFLDMYFEKGGAGGVFVEGELQAPLGELLDVEIHFASEAVIFRIQGRVRWRRTAQAQRRSVPSGVGIEFSSDEEKAHKLLVDFAHGKDVPVVQRASRRYGVGIPVRYKAGDGAPKEQLTDDISEGGAFIESDEPIEVGARVELKLLPPGSFFGVGVPAVVAWRRDDGRPGFGVEFVFDSPRTRSKVHRLIEGLKARVVRNMRVRAPR